MSGVDLEGRKLRKGAADAIRQFVESEGARGREGERNRGFDCPSGRDTLVVADGRRVVGVVELRDIVKAASASALRSCARWASRQ